MVKFLHQIFIFPLIALIKFYQKVISPLCGPRCKYYPTCSCYSIEALKTHGFFKGTLLSLWRLLRCNPWSEGGIDIVPSKGKWRSQPWKPAINNDAGDFPMAFDSESICCLSSIEKCPNNHHVYK